MEFGEVILSMEESLANLVDEGPEPHPIRRVHQGEPLMFEDAYPALVVSHREATDGDGGGSNEVLLPSRLLYNVSAYYPVYELSEEDGLIKARNESLMCFSAFHTAFMRNMHTLAQGGIVSIDTSPIRAGASDNQGVPFFNEKGENLFSYMWELTLLIH
jgi:hypothetical protein